ncbi:MAG: HAMP domain-containing sensor histidine kinase [Oscillospiraceae bacterium]|nr:HAMP domain-containing sensor histidine kinase [Oscillospiraceae bacterium]
MKADKKKQLIKSGITARWMVTTLLVIALILACIATAITLSIRGFYYETVKNRLLSMGQSSTVAEYFGAYIDSSEDVFVQRAQEYVENFSDINTAEVWVYDKNGIVVATSTGFDAIPGDDADYTLALKSSAGMGTAKGFTDNGEHIMALTVFMPKTDGSSNGAVRYIISLHDVDRQVAQVALAAALCCLFALSLVVLSGLFFVRSIVGPVKKINDAARRIASGNYTEKVNITNRYDEIAELSESINYMTDEIYKTDRLKNDFISTVSHELRTPLTAIKGWTETLLSINAGGNDPTLNEGLKVILNEEERLYSLVEDLLDFSRMQSGRMSLRLQKIDILAELDDAVYVLRDRARREGIDIFYSAPDYPAPAQGDPDRIKQVFVNIIDNAIKYTEPGGRIVIVAALTAKDVKISIADTGCGISPEDLPHVKEKFFKANKSVKGSGIGLAVCDEIVSMHHGKLEVVSTLGEGTTVIVSFPVAAVNLTGGKDN